MNKVLMVFVAACATGLSQAAQAYVGPGAGLSLLGALWGLLLALGAALVFLLLWPWRRYRHRRAQARKAAEMTASQQRQAAGAQARQVSGRGPEQRQPSRGDPGRGAQVGRG